MFRLTRPSRHEEQALLAAARDAAPSSPHLLSLEDGLLGGLPAGFVRDVSRSEIGRGLQALAAAREAMQRWEQFDLGWVQVVDPNTEIAPGELVGVEAHTFGLWSISVNRIVEVVDGPTRFGFVYATTAFHVEEGQERFVIEVDPESESVSYLIEAVSRPRHFLARIGYPLSRATQHQFARDSHAQMRRRVMSH